MTGASTRVAVAQASGLWVAEQARCLSHCFGRTWLPSVLCLGLLAGRSAVCRGQAGGGSSAVVPYRGNAAESPPATEPAPKSYGPVEAGQDAYQSAERERREAISRQLQTEDAVANNRAPLSYPGYYAPAPPAAVQVWGGRRAYRFVYRPPYVYPGSVPPGWLESWPFLGQDIYGYSYSYRIPQPWGHQTVVIGPGVSLVRPVYPPSPRSSPSPPTPMPSALQDLPLPALPKPVPPRSGSPERIPTPPAVEPAPIPPPPPAPGAGGAREF
jgi:hypothetical protein